MNPDEIVALAILAVIVVFCIAFASGSLVKKRDIDEANGGDDICTECGRRLRVDETIERNKHTKTAKHAIACPPQNKGY